MLIPFLALFSVFSLACDGGMFTKDLRSIPSDSIFANDMTEAQFKSVTKKFERFFTPILDRDYNSDLEIYASWKSNTVNAFAEQSGKRKMITVYGGLARHPAITEDGLTAVLCHELGHHLGGYPKKSTNKWSSAEGQSDYYATMKCLRQLWEGEDNIQIIQSLNVPQLVKEECARTFVNTKDAALCERASLAGRSVAFMIQDLDHDSWVPRFETPDPLVARSMNYMHPYAQCRLDTFFQGSICPVRESIGFDNDSESVGACHAKNGDVRGLRPRCWFYPRN
jgi:hypothetical protein